MIGPEAVTTGGNGQSTLNAIGGFCFSDAGSEWQGAEMGARPCGVSKPPFPWLVGLGSLIAGTRPKVQRGL